MRVGLATLNFQPEKFQIKYNNKYTISLLTFLLASTSIIFRTIKSKAHFNLNNSSLKQKTEKL